MTFSEPANRRIAGHCANCSELMGDQCCLGAHTSSRACGFTAGMAAANHHDVESVGHQNLGGGVVAKARGGVKTIDFCENVSRETLRGGQASDGQEAIFGMWRGPQH
jgi:hypothetical protein